VSRIVEATNPRRARNPLRAVFVVGIVGALLLVVLMLWLSGLSKRSSALSTKEPVAPINVSVLSVRRHPDVLSRTTRLNNVKAGMAAYTNDLPSGSCTSMTWLGETLTSINTSASMVPGSLVKILVAVAAIKTLGPDYTYTTEIRGNLVNGVVNDLYVVGGGDPLLVRRDYVASEKYPTLYPTSLEALIDAAVASGVKQVTGSVIGVESRYDTQRYVSVWPESFHGVEAGPLGALMSSDAMVAATGMRATNPADGAAMDVSSLLSARGVLVTGSVRVGSVADDLPVLASVVSAPMSDIVTELLVNSDNNTAELLLKEMGLKSKGEGSTAAGLTALQEFLQANYKDDVAVLSDGSGLSAQNGATCSLMMKVLADNEEWLLQSLAIAAETGTLRDFFKTSPVAGIMRAKTGTLTNVKGLAGYVPVEDDEAVRFSLIMNAPSADQQSVFLPHWNDLAEVTALASAQPSALQLAP
jgi:serine-type D-Ala-D-Ala carboxypeptidase/endopeptidase (penicillin-binding protein 4)